MVETLIFLCVMSVCLVLTLWCTYLQLNDTKKNYQTYLHLWDQERRKRLTCVQEYNNLVKTYNECVRSQKRLKELLKENINPNAFTKDEIKRLKHYLHPDKHNGKTNDLFVKISKEFK